MRILALILTLLALLCVQRTQAQDQSNGADSSVILSSDAQNTVALKRIWRILGASQTAATHAAWATVAAATDGAANFPARATRRRVAWINTSNETVYIAFATGVTGTTGVTVPAGATGGLNYTGAIYVHSASGAARVDFVEVYD